MHRYTHSPGGGVRKLNGINDTLFARERTVGRAETERGRSPIIPKTSDNAGYILWMKALNGGRHNGVDEAKMMRFSGVCLAMSCYFGSRVCT
jgi:hypothetical protein